MLDVLKQVRDNLRNALDDYDSDDDDEPYDKSRGKGWGTGDVNNGPGVEKRADGIKRGAIGTASDNDRVKMIKYLSTNDLKDGETPIIAHEGEVVLNSDQQEQLLDNVDTSDNLTLMQKLEKHGLKEIELDVHPLYKKNGIPEELQKVLMGNFAELNSFRPNINVPDYSNLVTKQSQPVNIDVKFGDWSFNEGDFEKQWGEAVKTTNMVLRQQKSKFIDQMRHKK